MSTPSAVNSVADNQQSAVALLEADGTILSTFGDFSGLFGCEASELRNSKILDFISCEKVAKFINQNTNGKAIEHKSLVTDCDCKRKDGRWVALSICLHIEDVTSNDSKPKISCSIARVALSPPKNEGATQHDERVNFALKNASQSAWECNLNTDEMWYSSHWYTMRGFEIGDKTKEGNDAWESRLHPDDKDAVLARLNSQDQGLEPENAFEYRERHGDGHWMWVMSRGRFVEWNEDGTPSRVVGTDTDITSIKEREAKELEQSRNFFEESIKAIVSEHNRARTEKHQAIALANQDHLTGLGNRRLLTQTLQHMLERPPQGIVKMLFYIDLDDFKPINDEHGHAAGDHVLKEIAERLPFVLRGHDVVTRVGGDEFAAIVERRNRGILGIDEIALRLSERLIDAIEQDICFGDQKLRVGASIGVAIFEGNHTTAEALIREADAAMYLAKQTGQPQIAPQTQNFGTRTGT